MREDRESGEDWKKKGVSDGERWQSGLRMRQKHKITLMIAVGISERSVNFYDTKVAGKYEGSPVLDRSAHLKSRVLVSQSAQVACCTLCVFLRTTCLLCADQYRWRLFAHSESYLQTYKITGA
jgi:hypothetical protein